MFGTRKILLAVALAGLVLIGGFYAFISAMPKPPVLVGPIKEDSELWRLMQGARAASRAEDHRRAADLYTQALAVEPGPNIISRDLLAARGSEYNYLGMSAEAFADFDAALKIGYPREPMSTAAVRAHMGRGYASLALKQYRRAKDDFDIVLKAVPSERPRSSSTLAWRGAAYQGLRDRERALADYKAALAIDPNNERAAIGLKDLGAQ
jgi:tetratricopeptide (TPR) repeat protein